MPAARLRPMTASTETASDPVGRRARRPAQRDRCRPPGLPRRPRAPRQHRLRELHAGGRRRGRALGRRLPGRARRRGRAPAGPRRPPGRHGRRHVPRPGGRPAGAADRAHGHGLRSGDRRRAPVPHRGRRRLRPGRHRHEVGPAGGPATRSRRSSTSAAACPSSGSSSSPIRTRRSARRRSTPHIREVAADIDVALVLECARANGDIVSARKGILDLRIIVHGRAAHAGRRAREGPQRDPRGGPDRRATCTT